MFSGLQALEALGSYPEANQITAAFLSNRGAMDYQLGNYKSSPVENRPNTITKLLNAPPMFRWRPNETFPLILT